MAKGDSVSIKQQQLQLDDIVAFYQDAESALRFYYKSAESLGSDRFTGYLQKDLMQEQQERIEELGVSCSFTLLSKVEAALRVDYLLRCRLRNRDRLTRSLRQTYKTKAEQASLEQDILEAWKIEHPDTKSLISDLRGALHYRHWIAHGRYWEPKLARRVYDYISVYLLAKQVLETFPLLG